MHIEPGVVTGAKLALGAVTATGSAVLVAKIAYENFKSSEIATFMARAIIATIATFAFFQVLPHYPVGVSEVHFIFGSTLFLMLGLAPAAFGLAAGLALQGLLFAPFDLPQYGMNITTLIMPLVAISYLAKRIIPANTAYVDLTYKQTLKLSTAYQAGIVAWVGFWVFYGQGINAQSAASLLSFGSVYMMVVLIEPLVDLGALAVAKRMKGLDGSGLLNARVYAA